MNRPTSPKALYRGLLEEYQETRPDLTVNQRKQIAYAGSREPFERLGQTTRYHCTCRTCNESTSFGAADSIRLFVNRHAGHDTWVETV